jgi:hypothetical protein
MTDARLSGGVRLDIHVMPMNDLRAHIEARTCWCEPRCEREGEDEAVVVIHASADGRELVEQHGVN